jgi:exosome complex component RRP4
MQRIVIPGEKLEDKPLRIEGAIVDNGKTYSTVMGSYDQDKKALIPLEGLWYPMPGDTVVGRIAEDKFTVYIVDLSAPYRGLIFSKDSNEEFVAGDLVEATVKELDKTQTAILGRPRKLTGGKLVYVKPSKIPRILGRGNNMIKQLTMKTHTDVTVGMNGIIWLRGGRLDLVSEALNMIQEEAHTSGLTNRVMSLLELGA